MEVKEIEYIYIAGATLLVLTSLFYLLEHQKEVTLQASFSDVAFQAYLLAEEIQRVAQLSIGSSVHVLVEENTHVHNGIITTIDSSTGLQQHYELDIFIQGTSCTGHNEIMRLVEGVAICCGQCDADVRLEFPETIMCSYGTNHWRSCRNYPIGLLSRVAVRCDQIGAQASLIHPDGRQLVRTHAMAQWGEYLIFPISQNLNTGDYRLENVCGNHIIAARNVFLTGSGGGGGGGDPGNNNQPPATSPQCADGIDNDGDGLIDFPIDPGCSSSQDTTENSDVTSRTPFYALTWWTPQVENLTNILPWYWMDHRDGWWNGPELLLDPQDAKQYTDAMPEGYRTMTSFWVYRNIFGDRDTFWNSHNPEDNCIDPSTGQRTEYFCIWYDFGIEYTRQIFDDFFREYRDIGGQIDFFVLDAEYFPVNWAFGSDITNVTQQAQWAAIQNDPRFGPVAQQLGFSDLSLVHNYWLHPHYLSWNQFAMRQVADAINRAVFEPMRRYFPDVKMSNWEGFYQTQEYAIPDYNSHNISYCHPGLYCGPGSHVGTHQARVFYGELGQISLVWNPGGGGLYEATPFNAFRYNANQMRASVLSSDVPVQPWFSPKSYYPHLTQNIGFSNSDYYQELLFHVALSGANEFLYWNHPSINPWQINHSDRMMDACLKQIGWLTGYNDRRTLVSELSSWTDNHMLTGMVAGGRKVWRMTPQLTIQSGALSTLPSMVQNYDGGVMVTVGNVTTLFPQGRVLWIDPSDNCYSNAGVWIFQPLSAPDPGIVASAMGLPQHPDRAGNPVALFISSAQETQILLPVTFDASMSYDADGTIVDYLWDFDGDGFHDMSGVKVEHRFTAPGTYLVRLHITDNVGQSATYNVQVIVRSKVNAVKADVVKSGNIDSKGLLPVKFFMT